MKFIPLWLLLAATALAQDATPPPATPTPKKAPASQQSSTPIPPPPASAASPRVLLVGGGDSHDFQKWFNEADRAIFSPLKPAYLEYTDNPGAIAAVLPNIDLLVWSGNLPMASDTAKAIMDYAAAGKPILIIHAGLWYSWKNFPEWNREIVGGGASKHDRFGEFNVDIVQPGHPVVAGLPAQFKVSDELYNSRTEPNGSPIEVLANASKAGGASYPSIWIVKHPKARIVCICLGHDGKVHGLPEYHTLLTNSYHWVTGK